VKFRRRCVIITNYEQRTNHNSAIAEDNIVNTEQKKKLLVYVICIYKQLEQEVYYSVKLRFTNHERRSRDHNSTQKDLINPLNLERIQGLAKNQQLRQT